MLVLGVPHTSGLRVGMLVLGVPHTSGLRVGILEWFDAERAQALLRAGASSFSDV